MEIKLRAIKDVTILPLYPFSSGGTPCGDIAQFELSISRCSLWECRRSSKKVHSNRMTRNRLYQSTVKELLGASKEVGLRGSPGNMWCKAEETALAWKAIFRTSFRCGSVSEE